MEMLLQIEMFSILKTRLFSLIFAADGLIWSEQVPSFARRSSVLADFREVSLEEGRCQAAKPMEMLRPQNQQYQLNSKKHHPYSSLCRERDGDRQSNGKKFYYQLNSKKHHHYQPELKVHGSLCAEGQEPKAPEPPANSYNLPPVLQQKWVRDKDSGCLTKVKDITMELKKLPADLSGHKEAKKVSCVEGEPPQSEGVRSGKLKIVKNKNKNGRIVIVMSKYMENGIHSAKMKTGQTTEPPMLGGDHSPEKHLEKMRLVRELGLMNGLAQRPATKPTAPSSGLNGGCPEEKEQSPKEPPAVTEQDQDVKLKGQEQLPADQPLQLTTKANLLSLTLDRGGQGGLQGLKRPLPDTANQEHRSVKRFVGSAPSPNPQEKACQGCVQERRDVEQEEPMDLRVVKPTSTEAQAERADRLRDTEVQAETQTPPEDTPAPASASCHQQRRGDAFPSFQPLLGNIVITDITTNCLTVTFKEYVAA